MSTLSASTLLYQIVATKQANNNIPAMPTGDLPGWTMTFSEDFDRDAPFGSFQSVYADRFRFYVDNTPDTAGKTGANSRYYPSKTLRGSTELGGYFDTWFHSEDIGGTVYSLGAGFQPNLSNGGGSTFDINQTYGRYEECVELILAPAGGGFKTADLLWTQDTQSGARLLHGEIDIMEGYLNGEMKSFMHRRDAVTNPDQASYASGVNYAGSGIHRVACEWTPSYVSFSMDGVEYGRNTEVDRIPNSPFRYIFQRESCLGQPCPDPATEAILRTYWFVQYAMAV